MIIIASRALRAEGDFLPERPASTSPIAVVALGGNAISNPNEPDKIANQFRHTRDALAGVADLVQRGYRVAVSHGNGPQVGNALLRVELAKSVAPMLPLGVIVADTEGGMGYMIEQCLQNVMLRRGVAGDVVTIVTQVLVDPQDPALQNPTKFIGQYYPEEEAKRLAAKEGWTVKPYGDRGWRRVVGSPEPLQIVNGATIKQLIELGKIVIAAGGGGIPVYREPDGWLEGVDAVIDKDRASAILARDIGAQELFILTEADYVALELRQVDAAQSAPRDGEGNRRAITTTGISRREAWGRRSKRP